MTIVDQHAIFHFPVLADVFQAGRFLLGEFSLRQRHVDTRVVDVHISRLRAKLEDDPSNPELILTARGTGYLFQRILEPGED